MVDLGASLVRAGVLVALVVASGCGGAEDGRWAPVDPGLPPDGMGVHPVGMELGVEGVLALGGRSFDLVGGGDSHELTLRLLELADGLEKERFDPVAGVGPLVPAEWVALEVDGEVPYGVVCLLFAELMAPDVQVTKLVVRSEAGSLHLALPRNLGVSVSDLEPRILLLETEPEVRFVVGELGGAPLPGWLLQEESFVATDRATEPWTLSEGALEWLEGSRQPGLYVRPEATWGQVVRAMGVLEEAGFSLELGSRGYGAPMLLERPAEALVAPEVEQE